MILILSWYDIIMIWYNNDNIIMIWYNNDNIIMIWYNNDNISCLNFLNEAWWFLSLRVFGLLSWSLLLFPQ